jgi:formylglycine-generating enzyme required for sulfatase activity
LYRNDPDSGIHGAADWTLRRWKQQKKLDVLDAELMNLKDRGERRWYVNTQKQTYAAIEGPVEFLMGSPPTEKERTAPNEDARRMRIPRRFAISAKEVTVEQFQRFVRLGNITDKRYHLEASEIRRYSVEPGGPWVFCDWYLAAHYCNWLSEQEGLSREEWCYLPNEAGAYAEGMSIPAGVLNRTGYRLPTEAEWEYACRAGAVTSRYHGNSIELLGAYARYGVKTKGHAGACGSLLPNDLGLYDMLGNMWEWCQDDWNAPRSLNRAIYDDTLTLAQLIVEKNPRVLRGGAFGLYPENVRSATRNRLAPSYRDAPFGFRPARTYR